MNHNRMIAILLVMLLGIAPTVMAQEFDNDYEDQTPDRVPVELEAGTTTVQSTRQFSVDQASTVKAAFTTAPPLGYPADLELKNGSAAYVLVGNDVTTTAQSTGLAVSNEGTLRVTVTIPSPANRDEGFVDLDFNITTNAASGNNKILHRLQIYFYNETKDSDADGLMDVWEISNFGNLSATADGDADEDSFTNEQEQAAKTNPNNDADQPRHDVLQVGGGSLDDREAGAVLAGWGILALCLALGVFFIKNRKKERKFLKIALPIGALLLLGLTTAFFLDVKMPGDGYNFWKYADSTFEEFVLSIVAVTIILGITAGACQALPQKKEWRALAIAGVAIAAVGGLSFLLFHVYDVPLPTFGFA